MAAFPLFRRILLSLHPGAIDREGVEFAAEMANLLGAALQGVFVEDEAVSLVGDLGSAQEFRLAAHEWRPVETVRLAQEMRLAASSAERLLREAAQRLGIETFFEVSRGEPTSAIMSLAQTTDILVVVAPKDAHERLARFHGPPQAMAPGSVLTAIFVPRRIKRRKGPVVALVKTPRDRGLSVAAAIARAAQERLILIAPDNGRLREALLIAADAAGVSRAKTDFVGLPKIDLESFLAATEKAKERLIVLTRYSEDSGAEMDPFAISSLRQSPVILVGPGAEPEV